MSAEPKFIPSSSQTVGPYFRIGLESLIGAAPLPASGGVTIRGRVLDGDRTPVPDAMLEFWSGAPPDSALNGGAQQADFPSGFRRVATDIDGAFSVMMTKPVNVPLDNGMQAPHLAVLVFARGLLRHLITRVYFDGERENVCDRVLLGVPAQRRHTLIAQADGNESFRWDVILQGTDETVFFAW